MASQTKAGIYPQSAGEDLDVEVIILDLTGG